MLKINRSTQVDTTNLEKINAQEEPNWLRDPGEYALEIVAIIDKGVAKDPNWHGYLLDLRTVGEEYAKKTTLYLAVPQNAASGLVYKNATKPDAKPTNLFTKKLMQFLDGVGYGIEDYQDLIDVAKAVFADPANLKGKKITATMQHNGIYIKYMGKNEEGVNMYQPHDRKGPLTFSNGAVAEICPSWESATNYLVAQGIPENKISGFPEMVSITPIPSTIVFEEGGQSEPSMDDIPF